MANEKILVPGCEPTSSLSSRTLMMYMSKGGCGNALVDLVDALEAIPGSYVKFGTNYNRQGYRQKWFVLPPITPQCPCESYLDYYRILKSLATTEPPVEEKFDHCDLIGMGYCPSPDFKLAEPPPANPYKSESEAMTGLGVLPPAPPWALD